MQLNIHDNVDPKERAIKVLKLLDEVRDGTYTRDEFKKELISLGATEEDAKAVMKSIPFRLEEEN